MMTLVVGADRDGMRCMLCTDRIKAIDKMFVAAAFERRERELIDMFLRDVGYDWEQVEHYISLQLPHSHTSVRVVATILKTSAWYYGKSYAALPVERLDELDAATLWQQLSVVEKRQVYS